MKRFLLILIAILLPSLFTGCDVDVSISVDARARLYYANGSTIEVSNVRYGPYYHRSLTNSDLLGIFTDLTSHTDRSFTTADLILHLTDEITKEDLGYEGYGVLYDSHQGTFVFSVLPPEFYFF